VSKVQDVVTRLVDEIRATPSLASAPEIEDALGSYRDAFERLVEVDDMVSTRIESFRGEAHSIEESAKMLAAEGRMVGQQQVGEAQQASSRVRWFIVGAVMVILLCGVVLSYILARSITVPIGLLTVVAQRIGAGELRAKAPVVSGDEVGCLAETFNEMTGRLAQSLDDIEKERETSEKLLRNVLPDPIALRLKKGQETIADQYDEATVLFADIVGFTRISSHLTATEIVSHLNVIFSTFDDLADRHGVEKIKTIGDAYMVASGLPEARSDHAEAVADMALGMRSALKDLQKETPFDLEIRIGICTGPLIAGVIGKKKFIYDLWGDTVNVASRMESHGSPGQIQVSSSTYHCLRDRYVLRERGSIEIKGKGSMDTYFLDGKMPGG
jgi:class 3 adenylate cyclase